MRVRTCLAWLLAPFPERFLTSGGTGLSTISAHRSKSGSARAAQGPQRGMLLNEGSFGESWWHRGTVGNFWQARNACTGRASKVGAEAGNGLCRSYPERLKR